MNIIDLKIKLTYLLCRCYIISKHRRIGTNEVRTLDVSNCNLELNVASSNNLIEITRGLEKLYFRFCDEHVRYGLLLAKISDRFCSITNLCSTTDILELLDGSYHNTQFYSMGSINNFESKVYKYFKNDTPATIGLNANKAQELGKQVVDSFVHYSWSEFASWKLNECGGSHNLFHYNRSRCQYELYKLFGVERLICSIDLVYIGSPIYCLGSIMNCAKGKNPLNLSEGEKKALRNPSLERELVILYIMDVLCYERDHRPGNYNIVFNDRGEAVSIQSFDNDSSLTFFPTSSISKGFVGCDSIVNSKGAIACKNLDMAFAKKFISVDESLLINTAKPYLNSLQQKFLLIRFRKLKKALLNTIYSEKHAIENISGNNAHLYYQRLLSWNENEKDAITLKQGAFKKIKINA